MNIENIPEDIRELTARLMARAFFSEAPGLPPELLADPQARLKQNFELFGLSPVRAAKILETARKKAGIRQI